MNFRIHIVEKRGTISIFVECVRQKRDHFTDEKGMTRVELLNSTTFNLLTSSVDAASLRHKVLANNIANADTPHFKRSDVSFEALLKEQLNARALSGYRTHPKHIPIGHAMPSVTPKVVTDHDTAMNHNGNNVDIDAEMAMLAQNQLNYHMYIGQISHEISMIRKAIGGGN